MVKNLISRSQAALRLFLVLGLAATTIVGCVSAEAEPGIFVVRTVDGALERIGEPAGIPVWSPVDDSLAWGSEDGLFVRALDESAARQLGVGPVAGVPAWSPDGRHLAYIDGDRASLVVVDANSGAEQFTQPLDRHRSSSARFTLLTLGGPAWAPDGSRLAYVCWDGAGDEICVIHSDGTGWRQVTRLKPRETGGDSSTTRPSLAEANTGPPAWSPRGNYLAVAIYPEQPGAPTGVFLVNPDEGVSRRVSTLQPNYVIRWFSDGSSILFSAFKRGRSDVYRVVLATTTVQTVTEGLPAGSRNPALSADGSKIAVESGGGIVVFGEEGPPQSFRIPGLRSSYPAWDPDATSIAVSGYADPIAVYN
jgi:Tol biopolymer transport system component